MGCARVAARTGSSGTTIREISGTKKYLKTQRRHAELDRIARIVEQYNEIRDLYNKLGKHYKKLDEQ